ncbi:MAG: RNA methyltransferase, partial [Pseudolabrys sp.]
VPDRTLTRPSGMTRWGKRVRGYFAIGVDGISKPMNLGNLMRISNAFGASFFFSVNAQVRLDDVQSDTSRSEGAIPFYAYRNASEFRLPAGCRMVGVEITDDAVELPRFRHPGRAAYVFGAERLSLSPQMLALCEFVVKIPTRFSINVGMAGAIVMYDRLISTGGYGSRPIAPGREAPDIPPVHKWGAPIARTRK